MTKILWLIYALRLLVARGFVLLILLWCGSCYYDNQEDLFPTLSSSSCDPGQVSFSTDILPVMNKHCNDAGCHNSLDRVAQVVLEDYTDLLKSANDASLLGSMRHSSGYIPMPEGAPRMDNCTINMVEAWINQGALNN